MNTLRKLQAYCKARGKCKGCELAYETPGAYICAFDSAPQGWELDRFEEEIGEIVGDED